MYTVCTQLLQTPVILTLLNIYFLVILNEGKQPVSLGLKWLFVGREPVGKEDKSLVKWQNSKGVNED